MPVLGFARVRAGRKRAASMARFLVKDVVPAYREAEVRIVRINTDGGPEFGRVLRQGKASAGMRRLGALQS